MVLIKNPEEDVTLLEELMFDEVFPDINSPGYWIAKTEEDIAVPKAIILDGHSTLLVYRQHDVDLPWSAYNELAQYKYQAEKIGDGAVLVPHTFYFEFVLGLSTKKIKAHANFDGTGINAITLPLKEVRLEDFFKAVEYRISEAMSSELNNIDDQIPTEEKAKFQIPSSSMIKLSMKLSLIGINTDKFTIMSSVDHSRQKGDMFEEIFDEPPTKVKEQLEEEEKEKKEARIKKAADAAKSLKQKKERSKKEGMAPSEPEDVASPAAERSITPPAPGGRAAPKSSGGPKSPPPGVGGVPSPGAKSAPPSARPASAPTPQTTSMSSPPSAPPKAALSGGQTPPPPSSSVSSPPPSIKRKMTSPKSAIADDSDPLEGLDFDDEEMMQEMDEDRFMAKGMYKTSSTGVLRHTHATYFDRMIPNRAYPIQIKITSTETGVKKSITSVVTGERLSEREEIMVIEEDTTLIIRPEFPGCLVVPMEQHVEISKDVEVKFHITPLATGKLDASVKFVQNGKTIHSMSLDTKVITHRLARWMTVLGTAASAVPMAFAFLLDEKPGTFMNERLDTFLPSLGYLGWILPGAITGVCLAISGLIYKIKSPSRTSKSLAFPH